MKRLLAAAAMTAVLAGPAAAQMSQGQQKTPLQLLYEKERQDQIANEHAYNEHMKRSKSQGTAPKTDPWAGVRPANDTNAKR
jgi:Ni/Co efflux regulator RcnB